MRFRHDGAIEFQGRAEDRDVFKLVKMGKAGIAMALILGEQPEGGMAIGRQDKGIGGESLAGLEFHGGKGLVAELKLGDAGAEAQVGAGQAFVELGQGAGGHADNVAGAVREHGILEDQDGASGADAIEGIVQGADKHGVVEPLDDGRGLIVLLEPVGEGDVGELLAIAGGEAKHGHHGTDDGEAIAQGEGREARQGSGQMERGRELREGPDVMLAAIGIAEMDGLFVADQVRDTEV
jgi:hypothetical protein